MKTNRLGWLSLCVLLLGTPASSSASLMLQAESVTVAPSGTGYFDVFAVIDDATPRSIAAYNARLDLTPATFGVSLDSADLALNEPLFSEQEPLGFATGDFLRVADNLPGINEATSLVDGDRLFRVQFSVPSGVPTGTVFDVNFNLSETFLFDGLAAPILIDGFTNGQITVTNFLSGDFDNDGDVDGADFLQWQRGGSPNPLGSSDLTNWENNFGNSLALAGSQVVPEPTTTILLFIGSLSLSGRWRANR